MKKDIHPTYNGQITAKCECGAEFLVGSTKDGITTEICSNCHPFFTGKQKLVDTAGRVDKFEAKRKAAASKQAEKKAKDKPEDDDEEEQTQEAEGDPVSSETPAEPKKAKPDNIIDLKEAKGKKEKEAPEEEASDEQAQEAEAEPTKEEETTEEKAPEEEETPEEETPEEEEKAA